MARYRRKYSVFDLLDRLRELARERHRRQREQTERTTSEALKSSTRETQKRSETAKTYNLFAKARQRFTLQLRDIFFKLETIRSYVIDVLRANNITTAEKITNAVRHAMSRIRSVDYSVLYELTKCVARYHTGVCGSKKYYVKITYTTREILRNLVDRFVLYIRNAIDNAILRKRLLNTVALVIHSLRRSRTKSRTEHYNSEYLANTNSTLDNYDSVSISKSDVTNTERRYSLSFLLRHPAFIARVLPVKLGLAEHSADSIHCSVYAMQSYASKRKHYRELPPDQYYDFITYESIEKLRGIT